jgi:hypothetical protein
MLSTLSARVSLAIAGATLALATSSPSAYAHCDTLGGPVVAAAKRALEAGDITPVLKWVKPDGEAEVRAAFARAVAVRGQGAEARDLADTYFFETLVRVHRAGEGAPYTGLKPAGEVEPVVELADAALESGSVERLATAIAQHVSAGVRQRFARALETKKHADESVAAGREFVEAYVEFTHYVERLHRDATTDAATGEHRPAPEHQH